MRTFIAIVLIALGAYFVFDAGKTIYNSKQESDSIESVGESVDDGEYQEVVTFEDVTVYNKKQTYTFLIAGAIFIIGGILVMWKKKKQQAP